MKSILQKRSVDGCNLCRNCKGLGSKYPRVAEEADNRHRSMKTSMVDIHLFKNDNTYKGNCLSKNDCFRFRQSRREIVAVKP